MSARSAITTAMLLVIAVPAAWAGPTYKVIYDFVGGNNGSGPTLFAALAIDKKGNLYGPAAGGTGTGCNGPCGVVFELAPETNGKWKESVIFNFSGYYVDGEPITPVVFDRSGNLYGGAEGGPQGTDLVYQLAPDVGGWNVNVVEDPGTKVGLVADAGGKNLYGFFGDWVQELSQGADGWNLTTLYEFCRNDKCQTGDQPIVPLSWDDKGNLYGTTLSGGLVNYKQCGGYCGVAFQMTPNGDGTWAFHLLHQFGAFGADGSNPYGTLTIDSLGNVYGTTTRWGPHKRGTVFKLIKSSGGPWRETILYDFPAESNCAAPGNNLVFDAAGNLYGMATSFEECAGGGNDCGLIFRLAPQKTGKWKFSLVHLFRGPDGDYPNGLTMGSKGKLYGTTTLGGKYNYGVVFEITP